MAVANSAAEGLELCLHQIAGDRWLQQFGYPFCGGVGAVRGAEGVVDVNFGQTGELGGEGGIIIGFAFVKADVLQKHDAAIFQLVGQQLQQEEQQMQRMGQMKSDSLLTQVKETIAKYGTDNGFTYVFAAGEGSSVLYGQESLDVTEAILKILNDEYKK